MIPWKFASIYNDLLKETLDLSNTEMNARTGALIFIGNPQAFTLDLSDNLLPTCGYRKTYPHVAAAEVAWCLLGHNHINWLRKHTHVWDDFATIKKPLGKETRVLWEAYGHRWRHAFGVDQVSAAVGRLIRDSSDRRVWISSWDPRVDLDLNNRAKTVPCPVGFTLSVVDKKLRSTLMIRSSDLFMGLPYDVMRHALFMSAAAVNIGVMPGLMTVMLAHPHIYETHLTRVTEMLRDDPKSPGMQMPDWSIDRVMEQPDDYVSRMRAYAEVQAWPNVYKAEVVR